MNSDVHPDSDAIQSFAEGSQGVPEGEHIESCPECGDEARSFRRLFDALEAPVVTPESLFESVMSTVSRERALTAARRPRWVLPRLATLAAAAAALLVSLVLLDGPARIAQAPSVFARAAEVIPQDALPSEVVAPAALDQVISGAVTTLEDSFEKARATSSKVMDPVKSSIFIPVLLFTGFLGVNAVAIWKLRRPGPARA